MKTSAREIRQFLKTNGIGLRVERECTNIACGCGAAVSRMFDREVDPQLVCGSCKPALRHITVRAATGLRNPVAKTAVLHEAGHVLHRDHSRIMDHSENLFLCEVEAWYFVWSNFTMDNRDMEFMRECLNTYAQEPAYRRVGLEQAVRLLHIMGLDFRLDNPEGV